MRRRLGPLGIEVLDASKDLGRMVEAEDVDVVLIGLSGMAALDPFLGAIRAGKIVAPANKEALVVAGGLLMAEARRSGARVIPVDSEQSALFQCLQGRRKGEVRRLYLTASGGPLRRVPRHRFGAMSVGAILDHPRWKMGRKITVDSATLMNKGFEVIEAHRLFGIPMDRIEVVVHPEAVVHAFVEFCDGSFLAQLSRPDMRLPIQYALTYPQRRPGPVEPLDWFSLRRLTFEPPQRRKFPCLELAIAAGRRGGTLPAVLNAANEAAVEAFLHRRIRFPGIYKVVEKIVAMHKIIKNPTLDAILQADKWARAAAEDELRRSPSP